MVRPSFILFLVITALTGCALKNAAPITDVRGSREAGASVAIANPRATGADELVAGLKLYDDGKYKAAATQLQAAIKSGLDDRDKVTAHKHLAFIYCVTQRKQLCRDEFAKALDVDPGFRLLPAEAGHPDWGPVFRALRSDRTAGG